MYLETIFLVYAVVLLAFLVVQTRFRRKSAGGHAAASVIASRYTGVLVLGLWMPALIVLYFLAGRVSVNRLNPFRGNASRVERCRNMVAAPRDLCFRSDTSRTSRPCSGTRLTNSPEIRSWRGLLTGGAWGSGLWILASSSTSASRNLRRGRGELRCGISALNDSIRSHEPNQSALRLARPAIYYTLLRSADQSKLKHPGNQAQDTDDFRK